jgi:hypothetical protein
MTLFHSTRRAEFTAHIGACLARRVLPAYGRQAFEVELSTAGLTVEEVEVSREDIDANNWPGDSDESLAALAARGVDIVVYDDMDPQGQQHQTYRLVSAAAVAAVASITPVVEEEEE